MISFLAHQAWLMGDAIARTLTRLFVTSRHLLEWVPAAQAAIGPRLDLFGFYRRMAGAIIIAAVAVIVASAWGHGTWPLALPFAALWIASPAIARWTSRSPVVAGKLSMSAWRRPGPATDRPADVAILRDLRDAGRSDAAAGQFPGRSDAGVGASDLADQSRPLSPIGGERPRLRMDRNDRCGRAAGGDAIHHEPASRASAAISTTGTTRRDLRPLDPQYISSVDSGNLAGHLIALANACREWAAQPLTHERRLAGIADALELMREEAGRLREGRRTQTVTWRQLDEALAELAANLRRILVDGDGHREASLDACSSTPRPWRTSPLASRDRTKRRHRRRHAVLGGGDPSAIESHRRISMGRRR